MTIDVIKKCDNCKNKDICQWVEHYQDIQKEANRVFVIPESPIIVNTTCRRFEPNITTRTPYKSF